MYGTKDDDPMAENDNMWRLLVNSLDVPDTGTAAPEMENIPPPVKKRSTRKFNVQKIVTEIYVYTDLEQHAFSEAVFQDLFLLGEMSEAKLKKLLSSEARRRNKDVDTE